MPNLQWRTRVQWLCWNSDKSTFKHYCTLEQQQEDVSIENEYEICNYHIRIKQKIGGRDELQDECQENYQDLGTLQSNQGKKDVRNIEHEF